MPRTALSRIWRWSAAAAIAAVMLPAATPSASAQEYLLKAAHTNAVGEVQDKGLEVLDKRLRELTGGKAGLQVFPNGQLGAELALIEGVLLGTIDMVVPSNAAFTNFVPQFKIFDMPFLFRDYDHVAAVVTGPVLPELQPAAVDKGLRVLDVYSSGIRHIMTREPVATMEDLKGRKIRTMQNPIHVEAFKAFGANATPMAYNELYGALQTGVVDGAEAANTNYVGKRFFEVADNWAMVGWLSLTAPVVISEKTFQSLPADIQEALITAAKESGVYERQLVIDSEQELLATAKSNGAKVTTPDPAPFRAASAAVYDKFLTTEAEKKLLTMVQNTQ